MTRSTGQRVSESEIRHHTIITGTGRAGTSFLVQLFTRLGLDTGFTNESIHLYEQAKAGLETDIRRETAPYFVKSPWLCTYIREALHDPTFVIDRAIVPMRSLDGAAGSRVAVEERTNGPGVYKRVPGGLWLTDEPERQSEILAKLFYEVTFELVRAEVPVVFLTYPRLVRDSRYLWVKLNDILFEKDGDRISY